jgi:hypothetical protein
MSNKKFCEDVDCPNLGGEIGDPTNCKLGFENPLVTPHNMRQAVYGDWGHRMPKVCRLKFRKVEPLKGG